jgi:hypothetical protein
MSHLGNELGSVTTRRAEREVLLEVLQEIRALREMSTHLMARHTGGIVNGVLAVETFLIPVQGATSRSYGTPIGSVVVFNPGGRQLTVHNAALQSSPPTVGTGVTLVPPGASVAVPVASPVFTVYGGAGDVVSIQAFTGLEGLGVRA